MPYMCVKQGSKWSLQKKDGSKTFGTHPTKQSCNQQMRAIYANETRDPKNLIFDGPIFEPMDFDARLAAQEGNEITLVVNSKGGDAIAALSMHNKLRATGKRIIGHAAPLAASAGAILLLAADEIYMPENGALMFHPTKIVPPQDQMLDIARLEEMKQSLEASQEMLINTLMSKTKKSKEECAKVLNNITWMLPEEAVAFGIVDQIVPIYRHMKIENYFPDRIVNSIQGKQNMPLKDICQKFGVSASDDDAEEKLVAFIEQLKKTIPQEKMKPSSGIVNALKTSRTTSLNNLVEKGKVTPAVADKLKLTYLDENRIVNDISNDDLKEFDNIVNALGENEEIFSFKAKTGAQNVPDPAKDDDLLVKNMEARKKKGA